MNSEKQYISMVSFIYRYFIALDRFLSPKWIYYKLKVVVKMNKLEWLIFTGIFFIIA